MIDPIDDAVSQEINEIIKLLESTITHLRQQTDGNNTSPKLMLQQIKDRVTRERKSGGPSAAPAPSPAAP